MTSDGDGAAAAAAGGGVEGLVEVSYAMVLVSAVPLLCLSFLTQLLDLGLFQQIWVSCARTFVQLAVLGYILKPIFEQGAKHTWVVLVYLLLMVVLAAREAAARPKYCFRGQYAVVFFSILINVALVCAFAFGVVIRPSNPLDPQYVIPIAGMLFGNVINGISLSLNALLTAFVEQQSEIELLLCFGATKWEASAGVVREALRTGTMPTLNSMAVIGLISIPGMMTGQVLGGSSPDIAARYQMLIMYLIAICGFGVILSMFFVVMRVAFNADHQLLAARFSKADPKQRSLWGCVVCLASYTCCALCNYWCAIMDGYKPVEPDSDTTDGALAPKANSILVETLNKSRYDKEDFLHVRRISRSVPLEGSQVARRLLFQDYSVALGHGEIAMVTGPSGAGKTQFLRVVAGLVPLEGGDLELQHKPRSEFSSMCAWRQKVRYVTQYKVESPGTPREYIRRICNLRVNRASPDAPTTAEMTTVTNQLLADWGMPRGSIDKQWKELSGGEAQRVIVAVAIASRPKVLLLDESTSALDLETKLRVEQSLSRVLQEQSIAVLWITHDPDQVKRISGGLAAQP